MVGRELRIPLCPHGEDHPGLLKMLVVVILIMAEDMVKESPGRDSIAISTTAVKMMSMI